MSNKPYDKLNELDQLLRKKYTVEMENCTRVMIRKVHGFELFNTRPYHNYENWSDGYAAADGRVYVKAEDLDDCLKLLCDRASKPDSELQPWERMSDAMKKEWGFEK